MSRRARAALLGANRALYGLARPLLFRMSAQAAHDRTLDILRWADRQRWLQPLLRAAGGLAFDPEAGPVEVGGVMFDSPLIVAAGLVKGDGFASEADALGAVRRGANIIPGWRSIPWLAGPVEFGSFTRWPRLGNPGVVVWRDPPTRSAQNRVGLRNPGAVAAAAFLAARARWLPRQFGVNVAASPGVDDPAQQAEEVSAALAAFVQRGVRPAWFTVNLSCPNVEDDPANRQTPDLARRVCGAAMAAAQSGAPVWVKVGPALGADQYRALMQVCAEVGVRAIIATNTLPAPAPGAPALTAGVSGGRLHAQAVEAAALLVQEKARQGYPVDVIGCGGVMDAPTYHNFARLGVRAVQYWTALIYRGPLVAALIAAEHGQMARLSASREEEAALDRVA
ncbi:MAG: hypothetical protein M5R40_28500 [Anaerolineae bacterium]|nr:hypothetical protein [Anaerolineae bacterium]